MHVLRLDVGLEMKREGSMHLVPAPAVRLMKSRAGTRMRSLAPRCFPSNDIVTKSKMKPEISDAFPVPLSSCFYYRKDMDNGRGNRAGLGFIRIRFQADVGPPPFPSWRLHPNTRNQALGTLEVKQALAWDVSSLS